MSQKMLFENRLHALRANVTMRLGINVIGQAKSSQVSYSELARQARRYWAAVVVTIATPRAEVAVARGLSWRHEGGSSLVGLQWRALSLRSTRSTTRHRYGPGRCRRVVSVSLAAVVCPLTAYTSARISRSHEPLP